MTAPSRADAPPALPPALLEVRGLTKSFRGIKAVDELSFAVAQGSITGLIGPNGSGKSTSVDCISGYLRIDAGSVSLGGRDITGLAPHEVAAAGMTRTFQNVRVYDRMTVVDNLVLAAQSLDGTPTWLAIAGGRTVRGRDAAAAGRGRELLELVGLARHADAPAGILSYGQKKLVALAMSLMSKPSLIILDEPLAGVNPTLIRHISGLIERLNRAGQTFLIIEHNVPFVMRHCASVVVMESGRKLAEGPAQLIRDDERVLQAYLGRSEHLDMEMMWHG
jgi:branched-chain amino acid transport system ATP-binding protein